VRAAGRFVKFVKFVDGRPQRWRSRLKPVEDFVVIGVRADEKPDDRILSPSSNGTVISVDSYRSDLRMRRKFFELEAGMGGVGDEAMKCDASLFLNGGGEEGKILPEFSRDV
jgi:hypothetical protein